MDGQAQARGPGSQRLAEAGAAPTFTALATRILTGTSPPDGQLDRATLAGILRR